jgi:hypothetical protein
LGKEKPGAAGLEQGLDAFAVTDGNVLPPSSFRASLSSLVFFPLNQQAGAEQGWNRRHGSDWEE